MKKILFFLSLLAMTTTAIAQTRTVNGAVIDKNGNPLPGAKVQADNGVFTTVNADGSFSLDVPSGVNELKFSYVGLGQRTRPITNTSMLVELKRKSNCFVNVESDVVLGDYTAVGVGLRAGYIHDDIWGGYARLVVPVSSDFASDTHVPTATVGLIGRIVKNTYLYGGLGYAKVFVENPAEFDDLEEDGLAAEAGLMYRVGKFNILAGYGFHTNCSEDKNHCLQIGVGFNF